MYKTGDTSTDQKSQKKQFLTEKWHLMVKFTHFRFTGKRTRHFVVDVNSRSMQQQRQQQQQQQQQQ